MDNCLFDYCTYLTAKTPNSENLEIVLRILKDEYRFDFHAEVPTTVNAPIVVGSFSELDISSLELQTFAVALKSAKQDPLFIQFLEIL